MARGFLDPAGIDRSGDVRWVGRLLVVPSPAIARAVIASELVLLRVSTRDGNGRVPPREDPYFGTELLSKMLLQDSGKAATWLLLDPGLLPNCL